jgi:hypothetical protein
MIPAKIVRFLEQHANEGLAGARDHSLVPCGFRVSGWKVHPDQRTMTVCVPEPLIDHLIACLLDNGQFTMTFGEHPTHETYQLKGRYVRHRSIESDDLPLVARVRERFGRSIRGEIPPGVSPDYVLGVAVPVPRVAIEIEVNEVYLQTPGPGAGSRIYPPPEA